MLLPDDSGGKEEPVPGMQSDGLVRRYGYGPSGMIITGNRPDAQSPVIRPVPAHEFLVPVAEKVAPGEFPVERKHQVAFHGFVRDKGACGCRIECTPVRGNNNGDVLRGLHPALDF